jgi:hypothetical protein
MCTPFFILPLRHAHDVVRVRQLARQTAALLSFETFDQSCLAAAAFDLAWQALQPTGHASVSFTLHEGTLRIRCTVEEGPSRLARWLGQETNGRHQPLVLEKQLPASPRHVVNTDLTWMLEQVMALSSPDAFEELQTANRELLRTLLDLAACRTKGAPEQSAAKREPDAA